MNRISFDRIAWAYDGLAKLVFGSSLMHSQKQYLHKLPATGKVLLIGGGTGKILEFIDKPDLEIHFVEKSDKMLRKARQRCTNADVRFISGGLNAIHDSYDAILTFYFLDVFELPALKSVIEKLTKVLKPGGVWLMADFQQPRNWRHRFLLVLMYAFFRLTAGLSVNRLYDFEKMLSRHLDLVHRTEFYSGFIKSALLKKSS